MGGGGGDEEGRQSISNASSMLLQWPARELSSGKQQRVAPPGGLCRTSQPRTVAGPEAAAKGITDSCEGRERG